MVAADAARSPARVAAPRDVAGTSSSSSSPESGKALSPVEIRVREEVDPSLCASCKDVEERDEVRSRRERFRGKEEHHGDGSPEADGRAHPPLQLARQRSRIDVEEWVETEDVAVS